MTAGLLWKSAVFFVSCDYRVGIGLHWPGERVQTADMGTAPTFDPRTADALRQAVGAVQSGDVKYAWRIAEAALIEGGDSVALNAFLGMLCARSGDMIRAIQHLEVAHRGRPDDATIACNLIAAHIETRNLAAAFDIATRDLAFADVSLRIARYRGFLAQSLEHFSEAAKAYDHVVKCAPGDFESWNNLGNARAALGDRDGSLAAIERAAALDPQVAPIQLNLAAALHRVGRDGEAEQILRVAADAFPGESKALQELYIQYRREGRQDDASAAIEEALARTPDDAELQLKYGIECGLALRLADAEQAFRRALAIDARLAGAYINLVIHYEHANREHEFPALIALAEANGLDEGALAFLRAMEHRRAGRFAEGLACVALVPDTIEPVRTMNLKAHLLDRLGRVDEAFVAFSETAKLNADDSTDPLGRAAQLRSVLRSDVEMLTPEWTAGWHVVESVPEEPDPVFLIGFPRSGTTLLDTILMGHPDTLVLEEQPPLNLVERGVGGQANVAELDSDGIMRARSQYFEEVEKVSEVPGSRLLIDKSPLFLSKVALIHRLFPRARFILAMRHPCDVLLSCFMSNFRLNTAMSNFLKLEDAAEFYDLSFQHWERARSLLPVEVHTVVYERLIESVEDEMRPLFDFLGLDWHEAALDHRRTAKARGLITTASYSQVTEPIYQRAAGRWQHYRHHLEPILPTLRPWIEKFGYTL